MAVMANGANLEWAGYQYARIHKGEIAEIGDLERLKKRKRNMKLPGKIMFRAAYVTDWMEANDDENA